MILEKEMLLNDEIFCFGLYFISHFFFPLGHLALAIYKEQESSLLVVITLLLIQLI
jgi:hypothetical protein